MANIPVTTDNNTVSSVSPVELLGIHDKFKFNLHIRNTCRPAANQLNALR